MAHIGCAGTTRGPSKQLHAAKQCGASFLCILTCQLCRHNQELEQDASVIACSQNSLVQAFATTSHSNDAGHNRELEQDALAMDQKAKLQQNALHAAKTGFLYNITQQACRHNQELEQDALAMDQEKAKLQQDALAIACS